MGLLNSTTWTGERLVADGIKLYKITGVSEKSFEAKDGKPACDTTFLTVALQEDANDTDGTPLEPGFFKDLALNTYPTPTGDDNLDRMGKQNSDLWWRIVAAALGEPCNKELPAKLASRGGADALKGKLIKLHLTARKGYQNIKDVMPWKPEGN